MTPTEAPASPLNAWETEAKALVELIERANGILADAETLVWEKPGTDRPEIADRVSIGIYSDPTADTVCDSRRIRLAEAVHALTHDRHRLALADQLAELAEHTPPTLSRTKNGYWWTGPNVQTLRAIRAIDDRKETLPGSDLRECAHLLRRYTTHLGLLVHRAGSQIDYYHQTKGDQ